MSSRKLLKNCLQVVQSTSAMFASFPKGCWDVAQVSTGTLELWMALWIPEWNFSGEGKRRNEFAE